MNRRTCTALDLGGALALLWTLPCFAQEPTDPVPQRVEAIDAARLYASACAPCHGSRGDGQGSGAQHLSPRPRDFITGVFKFQTTPTGTPPRDEDLYRTISRGVPGTWMPAWEALLTPAERWALVFYVKGFSTLAGMDEPASPVVVPPAPPASSELIREGRAVYTMLQCGKCHGLRGRGDGPSAATLEDDWGARIRPYDFTRGNYRNGSTPSDLYRTFLTGVSGTPMPALESSGVAFPGGPDVELAWLRALLSPSERSELEAYLATQPMAAALEQLMPPDVERLVQRRLWALVHYVRSLKRSRSLFYRLFRENPDVTAGAREP